MVIFNVFDVLDVTFVLKNRVIMSQKSIFHLLRKNLQIFPRFSHLNLTQNIHQLDPIPILYHLQLFPILLFLLPPLPLTSLAPREPLVLPASLLGPYPIDNAIDYQIYFSSFGFQTQRKNIEFVRKVLIP